MNEIKEKIEQVVKKLTADKNLMAKFDKNPVKVIEELLGVDLPDDIVRRSWKASRLRSSWTRWAMLWKTWAASSARSKQQKERQSRSFFAQIS